MTAAVVLVAVGFLLVFAEVVFPSLGVFGVSAAAAIVAADVLAWRVSTTFFWILVAVEVAAVPLLVKGALAALPHLPFGRAMLLAAPKPGPRSGVEAADHLVGRSGVATTDLRPSGTARFGDERRSVVADGPAIEAGQAIVVTAVEGYRIVVRAEESSAARSTSR